MERNKVLQLDTQGNCFLCLKRCKNDKNKNFEDGDGIDKRGGIFLLKFLSRYLNLELSQVFKSSGLIPGLENAKVVVPVCEDCSRVGDQFSDLYEQLEGIKLRLNYCVRNIHNVMVTAEEYHGEYRQLVESTLENVINTSIVDSLRREMIEKSSTLLKHESPRITLERLQIDIDLPKAELVLEESDNSSDLDGAQLEDNTDEEVLADCSPPESNTSIKLEPTMEHSHTTAIADDFFPGVSPSKITFRKIFRSGFQCNACKKAVSAKDLSNHICDLLISAKIPSPRKKPVLYKCLQCGKGIHSKDAYEIHKQTHQKTKSQKPVRLAPSPSVKITFRKLAPLKYQCDQCGTIIRSDTPLQGNVLRRKHIRAHQRTGKIQKELHNVKEILPHESSQLDLKGRQKCPTCWQFISKEGLQQHLGAHQGLNCIHCNLLPFETQIHLREHVLKFHRTLLFDPYRRPDLSEKRFELDVTKAIGKFSALELSPLTTLYEMKCRICYLRMPLKCKMEFHIISKHYDQVIWELTKEKELATDRFGKIKLRRLGCEYCNDTFANSRRFLIHRLRHHRAILFSNCQQPEEDDVEFENRILEVILRACNISHLKCKLCEKKYHMNTNCVFDHIVRDHKDFVEMELRGNEDNDFIAEVELREIQELDVETGISCDLMEDEAMQETCAESTPTPEEKEPQLGVGEDPLCLKQVGPMAHQTSQTLQIVNDQWESEPLRLESDNRGGNTVDKTADKPRALERFSGIVFKYMCDDYYKCSRCGRTLKKGVQLSNHIQTHLKQTFECSLCSLTFHKMSSLITHKMNVHQQKTSFNSYNDQKVGQSTSDEPLTDDDYLINVNSNLANVVTLSNDEILPDSPSATKITCQKVDVRATCSPQQNNKPFRYKCPHCVRSFSSKLVYQIHSKIHKSKSWSITDLKTAASSSPLKITFTRLSCQTYQCNQCGLMISSGKNSKRDKLLIHHSRSHRGHLHPTKLLRCYYCPATFKKAYPRWRHKVCMHRDEYFQKYEDPRLPPGKFKQLMDNFFRNMCYKIENGKFTCSYCKGKHFQFRRKIAEHVISEHVGKIVSIILSLQNKYLKKMFGDDRVVNENDIPCYVIDDNTGTDMRASDDKTSSPQSPTKTKLRCFKCLQYIPIYSALRRHSRTHKGLDCIHCSDNFTTMEALRNHVVKDHRGYLFAAVVPLPYTTVNVKVSQAIGAFIETSAKGKSKCVLCSTKKFSYVKMESHVVSCHGEDVIEELQERKIGSKRGGYIVEIPTGEEVESSSTGMTEVTLPSQKMERIEDQCDSELALEGECFDEVLEIDPLIKEETTVIEDNPSADHFNSNPMITITPNSEKSCEPLSSDNFLLDVILKNEDNDANTHESQSSSIQASHDKEKQRNIPFKHVGNNRYKCRRCGTILKGSSLNYHLKRHLGQTIKCRHCPATFPSISALVVHKLNSHRDALFGSYKDVNIAPEVFKTLVNKMFSTMEYPKLENNMLGCPYKCDIAFIQVKTIISHIIRQHLDLCGRTLVTMQANYFLENDQDPSVTLPKQPKHRYKCHSCVKSFIFKKNFDLHMIQHHNRCKHCSTVCLSRSILLFHTIKRHPYKIFPSIDPSQNPWNEGKFTYKVHNVLSSFISSSLSCNLCSYTNPVKRQLKVHLLDDHLDQVCKKLEKVLQVEVNFKKLSYTKWECKNCSKKVGYGIHKRFSHVCTDKSKQRLYKCPHCAKAFYESTAVSNHIFISHKEAKFKECRNSEIGQDKFKELVYSVFASFTPKPADGDKISCYFCKKQLNSKVTAFSHMATLHAGEIAPYLLSRQVKYLKELENQNMVKLPASQISQVMGSCHKCGEITTTSWDLEEHLKQHKGFTCAHCSNDFKDGNGLREHVLKFHRGKVFAPFKLPSMSDKEFEAQVTKTLASLIITSRGVSGLYTLKCRLCSQSCPFSSKMEVHIVKQHSDHVTKALEKLLSVDGRHPGKHLSHSKLASAVSKEVKSGSSVSLLKSDFNKMQSKKSTLASTDVTPPIKVEGNDEETSEMLILGV